MFTTKKKEHITYEYHYPHEPLIEFFSKLPFKMNVLVVNCQSGTNSIPIARIGHNVTAFSKSLPKVEKTVFLAENNSLTIEAKLSDMYEFEEYHLFDVILFDNTFDQDSNNSIKEQQFILSTLKKSRNGSMICFYLEDSVFKRVKQILTCTDSGYMNVREQKFTRKVTNSLTKEEKEIIFKEYIVTKTH